MKKKLKIDDRPFGKLRAGSTAGGRQQASCAHLHGQVGDKTDDGKRKDKEGDLKKKYNELEHKYQRALADYQNLLKQTARERQEFVKFANEELLYKILPVYDNLKLALKHANKMPNNESIKDGVAHVIKQFKNELESMGVEEIKTVDKKFDHNTMEAISGKGDKVKKEVKPGYKLNGKVIIPAKVILE